MLTNLKLFGVTSLSLLVSALVISPGEAKPLTEFTQQESFQIAQLDNNESIERVVYPVGIVRTIEGNMVTIQLSNGETNVYQVSPTEMETWKLYTGSYVLVNQNTNKILDTVYKGEIRSIVGSVVTVELADGKLEKYGLDRRTLGAMNLIEGQKVYVTKSEILALAPQPDLDSEANLINTTSPADSYQQTQVQKTQPLVENNQPQEPQRNQNYQQPDTFDSQTDTQETQTDEPVRGMW